MLADTTYALPKLVAESLRRLLWQGKPAVEGGSCKYLAFDGSRCALGILVPADVPEDALRRATYEEVVGHIFRGRDKPAQRIELGALSALQAVHDHWSTYLDAKLRDDGRDRPHAQQVCFSLTRLSETDAIGWEKELGDDLDPVLTMLGVRRSQGEIRGYVPA